MFFPLDGFSGLWLRWTRAKPWFFCCGQVHQYLSSLFALLKVKSTKIPFIYIKRD